MSAPTFIAEVSSNHSCDAGRAGAFVDTAAAIGCAGVKFQQFRIDELFAPEALAAEPKLAARRAWEMPEAFNAGLAARARDRGILYASTPFYRRAIEVLEPHVDFFKISSYQVLWLDFLREVASTGKPVVLATGMATLEEVEDAVGALRSGGCERPTLLHCVSCYPTPPEEANLAAIATLREAFALPIGWSDHTVHPGVVQRAVCSFGAEMVEFHLDLDRGGEEYSFGHCWLPGAARETIARALAGVATDVPAEVDGDGSKEPRPDEGEERLWRSDPADGLRPLRERRARLRAAG